MSIKDIMNIKEWIMDGLTTPAFDNSANLAFALKKIVSQYLIVNGNYPTNIMPVIQELEAQIQSLKESRLIPGHPDNVDKRCG